MNKTTSEQLFEQFCATNATPCQPIATDDGPTPDYEVEIGGTQIVVEIKELTPNEEDKKVIRKWNNAPGEFIVWGGTPCKGVTLGKRIRDKIEVAKHQIKRLAAGRCPGILLLYDTRPYPLRGFDSVNPYEIKVGMYGFETIGIHVSGDAAEPLRFGAHRFGKGKKVRPGCHAYISALGVLREAGTHGEYHVDLYLNVHADPDHPLPVPALVSRSEFTVYTLVPGRTGEFRGWERMVPQDDKLAAQASDLIKDL